MELCRWGALGIWEYNFWYSWTNSFSKIQLQNQGRIWWLLRQAGKDAAIGNPSVERRAGLALKVLSLKGHQWQSLHFSQISFTLHILFELLPNIVLLWASLVVLPGDLCRSGSAPLFASDPEASVGWVGAFLEADDLPQMYTFPIFIRPAARVTNVPALAALHWAVTNEERMECIGLQSSNQFGLYVVMCI